MEKKEQLKLIKKEVRRLRISTGVSSQAEFIEKHNIPCSINTYCNYESGGGDIKVGLLISIVGAHNLNISDFIDNIDM